MGWIADFWNKIVGVEPRVDIVDQVEPPRGDSAKYEGGGGGGGLQSRGADIQLSHSLLDRYADYEAMDVESAEISFAFDVYADEATQPEVGRRRRVWVESSDKALQEELDDLVLRLFEGEMWEIARCLVKYGNDFEALRVVPGEGVVSMAFLPAPQLRRVEERGVLLGFYQTFSRGFTINSQEFAKLLAERMKQPVDFHEDEPADFYVFEPWEVVQARLRGPHRGSVYGYSVADSSRSTWKRLSMAEDAALVFRLSRAPTKFVWSVDCGDMTSEAAKSHVKDFMKTVKKAEFVDRTTGKLHLKWNPVAIDEDYFIPMFKGRQVANVTTLDASGFSSIEDLAYLQRKLATQLKIPAGYMNLGDGGEGEARSTLVQRDVRFARTILRIQEELTRMIDRVIEVHLSATDRDAESLDWSVRMVVPSAVFELLAMEVMGAKADMISKLQEMLPMDYLMERLMGITPDEYAELSGRMAKQKKAAAGVEADIAALMNPEVDTQGQDAVDQPADEPQDAPAETPAEAPVDGATGQGAQAESRRMRESKKLLAEHLNATTKVQSELERTRRLIMSFRSEYRNDPRLKRKP